MCRMQRQCVNMTIALRRFPHLLASSQRKVSNGAHTFYVTTPIFYVNAGPHIGHLYSAVLADTQTRWQRMRNPQTRCAFAVGTDEHGQKIAFAAARADRSLPEYCTIMSAQYTKLFDHFNIRYTDFVRTTEPRHKAAVRHLWETLANKGYLYEDVYKGWYCTNDEAFYAEEDLERKLLADGTTHRLAPSGHPVEWVEEENYVFRLGQFVEPVRRWLLSADVIHPDHYKSLVLSWLEQASTASLSVSRPSTRMHWGVDVPGDSAQKIYVWLDALTNYLTVAGYPQALDHWPPDIQVVGKDILKFHAIYWPAFLMAAELPLPKRIFCHAHWTVGYTKMSKSKGNVVCPFDQAQKFTVDGLRYFLVRHGVPHKDGNYDEEKVQAILNSELANTLGNLLNRSIQRNMNPQQKFPPFCRHVLETRFRTEDALLCANLAALPDKAALLYDSMAYHAAVDALCTILHQTNEFFQYHSPWKLTGNPADEEKLNVVLSVCYETLRVVALLLQPIVPTLADFILTRLGVQVDERTFAYCRPFEHCSVTYENRSLGPDNGPFFKRIELFTASANKG